MTWFTRLAYPQAVRYAQVDFRWTAFQGGDINAVFSKGDVNGVTNQTYFGHTGNTRVRFALDRTTRAQIDASNTLEPEIVTMTLTVQGGSYNGQTLERKIEFRPYATPYYSGDEAYTYPWNGGPWEENPPVVIDPPDTTTSTPSDSVVVLPDASAPNVTFTVTPSTIPAGETSMIQVVPVGGTYDEITYAFSDEANGFFVQDGNTLT